MSQHNVLPSDPNVTHRAVSFNGLTGITEPQGGLVGRHLNNYLGSTPSHGQRQLPLHHTTQSSIQCGFQASVVLRFCPQS